MRKEKLQLTDQHKIVVENATSDTIRGALLRGTEDKGGYACPRCKKKYSDEDKFKVHLASHGKVSSADDRLKFSEFISYLQKYNKYFCKSIRFFFYIILKIIYFPYMIVKLADFDNK